MSPATGFSYHRLRPERDDNDYNYEQEIKRAIDHVKARIRRSSRLQRVHLRRRLKMKIPSLSNIMKRRARLIMVSMAKVVKRLKDSQSHFGDLFAGNYLFMQVNPTPIKSSSEYAIRASVKRIEDELRVARVKVQIHKVSKMRRILKTLKNHNSQTKMKVVKRLKDSQSHFGDLFAGNYLFMQVNPTPIKSSSEYAIRASVKRIEDELRVARVS